MSNIDFSKTYLTNGLSTQTKPTGRRLLIWLTLITAAAIMAVSLTK